MGRTPSGMQDTDKCLAAPWSSNEHDHKSMFFFFLKQKKNFFFQKFFEILLSPRKGRGDHHWVNMYFGKSRIFLHIIIDDDEKITKNGPAFRSGHQNWVKSGLEVLGNFLENSRFSHFILDATCFVVVSEKNY